MHLSKLLYLLSGIYTYYSQNGKRTACLCIIKRTDNDRKGCYIGIVSCWHKLYGIHVLDII